MTWALNISDYVHLDAKARETVVIWHTSQANDLLVLAKRFDVLWLSEQQTNL
jgi:hypothetical protein